jgi:6-phospho-beta-glucosidase
MSRCSGRTSRPAGACAAGASYIVIERIAVLGGSSVYTPEFISSIIAHNLGIKEVVLMGRSERKLKLVAEFCQRMFDKNGFPTRVIATTDIKEAAKDAKYIVNQIRVGGMMARARDERIPPQFGMVGDESLGAGGFANAARTLPVVVDYVRKINKVNKNAMIIDLSNPMSMIVEAAATCSDLTVIGVCDTPRIYGQRIAKALGVNVQDLWIDYFGLNHLGWIQDVKVDGCSAMDKLLDRIVRKKVDGFDIELVRLFRMIPTRSVSVYFRSDEIVKRQSEMVKFRGEKLYETEQQILGLYENSKLADVPELTKGRNALWYELSIVPLIEALESGEPREFILCVKNGSALRGMPEDAVVEVPALVSNGAVKVERTGESPWFLRGLLYAVKASERLAVEAILNKSYDTALRALVINPLVPSLDAAKKFLDKIVDEEKLALH